MNIPLNGLTGQGTIIAILDSGIDYFLPNFKNKDQETKIVEILNLEDGVSYSKYMINEALREGFPKGFDTVPITDNTGHGTAVGAIATEVAPDAELLIIKLGKNRGGEFPLTTQLMRGIDYAINYAVLKNKPIAINISYGNTYGSHRGDSLIERFIDNVSEIGRSSIIIGAGNEGSSNGHIAGSAFEEKTIELLVVRYETGFSLQVWKYYQDVFDIRILSPDGGELLIKGDDTRKSQTVSKTLGDTELLCFLGKPQPYSFEQEIFVDFIPKGDYVTEGVWRLEMIPVRVVTGEYSIYLSGYSTRNMGTGFLKPTMEMTITIPATSAKSISVGAYDGVHGGYADFSGNGYVYRDERGLVAQVKPDIVAAGVDITVPLPNGGLDMVSGTSFAAPYVSGLCSLYMEWGIVKKNDIYLYGEKLKAFLIDSAVPVESNQTLPNSKIGWGKVDFLR